ncbi:MAG: hypothetical protein HN623_03845, partial [Bdellovibrionales bacterium]|nr:hypothetical protein [Bdellovibrionales bacterium]
MIKIARLIPTVLLALLLLGNSSCGYLSDQAKSDQQIVDSTSLTGCQLDPDSFTHILQRDLTKQIECLEKNFIHFTRYVKREHQDSIHQGEISRFIRKFFVNNSETILQALNLMFEFNMLFLSDHTQGVSQDNIDPLFELLLTVNREAVVISNILTKINHKNFWQNRHRFKQSINRFSQATLNIISLEGRLPTQIQIRPFLRKIKQRLSSISFDVERVESFLFVKNILLGGDREVITSTEIQTLVGNAPKILTMAFDLFYLTSQNFDSEAEYFRFMADKVDEFRTIYYKRPGNSPLFTMEEFITASDIFASDEFRLGDYRENLLLVKERMFGPPADIFLMDDLEELLSVTRLLLRSLPDNLNIVVLLRSLKNIFDESTINFKMAESALFLKQLVLGGSRELITLKEVNTLLTKSPQLLKIFNLTSQMRQAPDTRKKMALAQQALTQLQPLLVPLPAEAMLTTVKSLLQFADDLTHGEYQLMEKLEELKTLKVTFLGGERESISVSDFHNAINVTKYLVTTLPDGMNLSQLISDYPTLVINRSIDLEFLEMLNTYKRVLAGGESGVITVDEIKLLLEHRKPLERLTNRLANRPPLSIDDRKSFIYFLKVIEDLTPLIFDGPKEQVATTISDVVATINGDSSTPDIINDELKESIHQLKKSLLGGDRDQLTFQEVKDLLYITEIFLRDIQQELSIIPFLARVDTISRLSLRPERWKPLLF